MALAFSSEEPVELDHCFEVLGHAPGDFDFTRLNNGAPLLINHDVANHVGKVESAKVQTDGMRKLGRAIARFSKTQAGEDALTDAADGIRPHVSVGYVHTRIISSQSNYKNGKPLTRFAWAAHEISLASIPADVTVGVGRSQSLTQHTPKSMNRSLEDSNAIELQKKILHDFPNLDGPVKKLAARMFCKEISYSDFVKEVGSLVNNIPEERTPVLRHEVGMNSREIRGYSIVRALASAVKNNGQVKDCPEADYSREVEIRSKTHAEGFFIPTDPILGMSRRDYMQRMSSMGRDLNVNTFGAGGALVETDIPTSIIELLRNRTVCIQLGATVLSGLEGNCSLPRETAPNTPYSLPETAALASGNPIIDQVNLSPKRVGATCVYSKQLLLQSSIDVENFVRDDLTKVVAIDHDRLALNGQAGNGEPCGILNTAGIGSVVFGGPATWGSVTQFEEILGLANADRGAMAWATTPGTRYRWKNLAKNLLGANTVTATALWEPDAANPMPQEGGVYGRVNQYLAVATNQIPNNQVLFGDWTSVILAMWGGWDVVVNPYSLDINAQVRITINTFIDVALRHPQSFCISADAGNL